MGKTKDRVVELEGRLIALEAQVSALRIVVTRLPVHAPAPASLPTNNPTGYPYTNIQAPYPYATYPYTTCTGGTAPIPEKNPNPYSGKAHIFEGGKR